MTCVDAGTDQALTTAECKPAAMFWQGEQEALGPVQNHSYFSDGLTFVKARPISMDNSPFEGFKYLHMNYTLLAADEFHFRHSDVGSGNFGQGSRSPWEFLGPDQFANPDHQTTPTDLTPIFSRARLLRRFSAPEGPSRYSASRCPVVKTKTGFLL
jgi:hypothetical protein